FCEKCAIYKKNEQYVASEPLPSWERYFSEHSEEPTTRDVKSTQEPWQEKHAISQKRPPPYPRRQKRPRPEPRISRHRHRTRMRSRTCRGPRHLCGPVNRTKQQPL